MADTEQRFVEIVDPEDGSTRWRLDAGFLTSAFTCIWGAGCQGIHDERHPELMDGCCSVGVVLADEEEAMNVVALAATIEPARFQHAGLIDAGGLLDRAGPRWSTRVVDGACVFLNRPGFDGGAGCALHLGAEAAGDAPTDWKPRTCNRVPVRVEEHRELDETVVTVRAWRRDDWGPGGETMAWWCTEADEAYVADSPLHRRIEPELLDVLGSEVLEAFRRHVS